MPQAATGSRASHRPHTGANEQELAPAHQAPTVPLARIYKYPPPPQLP